MGRSTTAERLVLPKDGPPPDALDVGPFGYVGADGVFVGRANGAWWRHVACGPCRFCVRGGELLAAKEGATMAVPYCRADGPNNGVCGVLVDEGEDRCEDHLDADEGEELDPGDAVTGEKCDVKPCLEPAESTGLWCAAHLAEALALGDLCEREYGERPREQALRAFHEHGDVDAALRVAEQAFDLQEKKAGRRAAPERQMPLAPAGKRVLEARAQTPPPTARPAAAPMKKEQQVKTQQVLEKPGANGMAALGGGLTLVALAEIGSAVWHVARVDPATAEIRKLDAPGEPVQVGEIAPIEGATCRTCIMVAHLVGGTAAGTKPIGREGERADGRKGTAEKARAGEPLKPADPEPTFKAPRVATASEVRVASLERMERTLMEAGALMQQILGDIRRETGGGTPAPAGLRTVPGPVAAARPSVAPVPLNPTLPTAEDLEKPEAKAQKPAGSKYTGPYDGMPSSEAHRAMSAKIRADLAAEGQPPYGDEYTARFRSMQDAYRRA